MSRDRRCETCGCELLIGEGYEEDGWGQQCRLCIEREYALYEDERDDVPHPVGLYRMLEAVAEETREFWLVGGLLRWRQSVACE